MDYTSILAEEFSQNPQYVQAVIDLLDQGKVTELCAELDAAEEDLKAKLEAAGFRYDAEQNRFR